MINKKMKGKIKMNTFASIMEMMMVVCFGISWPLNIIKAWRSRSAKGISLPFYFFIWIGYVFAFTQSEKVGALKPRAVHTSVAFTWFRAIRRLMFFAMVSLFPKLTVSPLLIVLYGKTEKISRKTEKNSEKLLTFRLNRTILIAFRR